MLVIEIGVGIVYIYFDKSGDFEKGKVIVENVKFWRVSVCNVLDMLLIY